MKVHWLGITSVVVLVACCLPGQRYADASALPDDIRPGQIIERVVCKDVPDQTYALYLPSNYLPDRKSPLIAAFDPGARGNLPVERFKDAAERYGYIVCGSNNSRNGPLQPSAEAAKAMLGDVSAKFNIDPKRVYLTGFSGGARAATAIGVWLKDQIAGVIGCGAGLAVGLGPASSLPFAYYGIVGNEDFNYGEMKQLDRDLDSTGVVHRVDVFEGGHGWPPSDACVRAIEWVELQAMKTGRRSRDDEFVDRMLKSAKDVADANESTGRAYDAYIGYSSIAVDFKGLRDVSAFEQKAGVLRESKAIKQAIARDRDQETEQRRRVSEMFDLRAKIQQSTNDPTGQEPLVYDLRRILSDLKRRSEAKENTPDRATARRALNQYTIASFEQWMSLIQTKKYALAVSNLTIDSQLMPDNWRVWYNLACAYSLNGEKRRAIDALDKAVQKGFSNAQELARNGQLDAIREEAAFKKIVERLRQPR